jgi:hypothetical protein
MLVFHQLEGLYGASGDDETDVLADQYTTGSSGSFGDGVSISVDGTTWYRLQDVRTSVSQPTDGISRVGPSRWRR